VHPVGSEDDGVSESDVLEALRRSRESGGIESTFQEQLEGRLAAEAAAEVRRRDGDGNGGGWRADALELQLAAEIELAPATRAPHQPPPPTYAELPLADADASERLCAMGFAEADVALALASTGGCMQPALEQLVLEGALRDDPDDALELRF
jgi:hypothetical protein